MLDKFRDECGVFGIFGHPEAANLTYLGLYALQRLLVAGIAAGLIRSAHDCAEGGVAVTLAECCFDSGLGATIDVPKIEAPAGPMAAVSTLFGESASRVIVSVDPSRAAELERLAAGAGVPAAIVGRVGGERIRITIGQEAAIDESLADAERIWSEAIGAHFDRERAIA